MVNIITLHMLSLKQMYELFCGMLNKSPWVSHCAVVSFTQPPRAYFTNNDSPAVRFS